MKRSSKYIQNVIEIWMETIYSSGKYISFFFIRTKHIEKLRICKDTTAAFLPRLNYKFLSNYD